ncbi:hypothetical protein [Priestia megaterium]|uniref:hypothetical protein n=1 Tax=Priestia megaterium TaxID=1404 RepID=UPI0023DAD37B|nr:hypothetical protein [Priestia megaterium]MDF2010230.1 hypothetical protein [Priestia megaterium]
MKEKHLIHVNGIVEANVDYEEYLDSYLEWLESKGWTYSGRTTPVEDKEEAEGIFTEALK